jgi:hypothetical protein
MNRKDIIFLGILFLEIIIIGILFMNYFKNVIEGFEKSIMDVFEQNITNTNNNSLAAYILNPSNSINDTDKEEIFKYIDEIKTKLNNIFNDCNGSKCINVQQSKLLEINNIIDPTSGTLTNYINTSSTIMNKPPLISFLQNTYDIIISTKIKCNNNLCT